MYKDWAPCFKILGAPVGSCHMEDNVLRSSLGPPAYACLESGGWDKQGSRD